MINTEKQFCNKFVSEIRWRSSLFMKTPERVYCPCREQLFEDEEKENNNTENKNPLTELILVFLRFFI